MHDSFQPLGGVVPMALMMLNVDFSGIGAGFLNMLMYVIVAVFLGAGFLWMFKVKEERAVAI